MQQQPPLAHRHRRLCPRALTPCPYYHQVKAARDQIEEENRLNLAELPDDVTLLNPPKVDGA